MVDSIGGAGGPQNLSQLNRTQNNKNTEEKRSENVDETPAQDEVSLSEEALAAQAAQAEREAERQAEKEAKEARALLEEQSEETLSNDSKRVDEFL